MTTGDITYIESLRLKAARLSDEARTAQREYREALEAAADYHVGDVVEAERYVYQKGRRYNAPEKVWQPAIIRKVHASSYSTTYDVSWQKKNGQWSSVVSRSWSYGGIRRVEAI